MIAGSWRSDSYLMLRAAVDRLGLLTRGGPPKGAEILDGRTRKLLRPARRSVRQAVPVGGPATGDETLYRPPATTRRWRSSAHETGADQTADRLALLTGPGRLDRRGRSGGGLRTPVAARPGVPGPPGRARPAA